MTDTGEDAGDTLRIERDGAVLRVTFNRPARRNAMTWAMYDGLMDACTRVEDDPEIRVLVLRGAGGEAFVAGTDIEQFGEFVGGAAGVEYERRMSGMLDRLAGVRVPTVAVVTGYCIGAGLALAASCDLRIASHGSRFGVPIARTVGNCLSAATVALLVDHLGPGRTLDLLLRARLLDTDEAAAAGFLTEVCAQDEVDATANALVERLLGHAPLTMWAAKEAVRRIRAARVPDDSDLIHRVYDSADFRAGVRAFVAKERPTWTGR
ncbi:enoyl-CoA hydratase [Actinopolymorpha pittospori]|uniref:Enoyl-CoA hydratase/carnithine racemase n=1 Tax=Actinopolymorpha pittospori TaxID=648752 RepID=A0A927N6I2_9ACTN|nr:enoyl-CoA hydratase/carnithine racemase [Actinopolymorpha pittospori]